MSRVVLCAHEVIREYHYAGRTFGLCDECSLPEGFPPILSTDDDMVPWWVHKRTASSEMAKIRPVLHSIDSAKVALRIRRQDTEALIEMAREFGEDVTPFEEELVEIAAERAAIWP